MNIWKLRPLARSRARATGKEERMDWVRLYVRNEKNRLEALHYLGPRWVLHKKSTRRHPDDLLSYITGATHEPF